VTRRLLGGPFAALACSAALAVTSACSGGGGARFSSDASAGSESGAANGGAGPSQGDDAAAGGGPSLPFGAVSCGGETCLAGTSAVQSTACCTDLGACGVRIVLSSKCLSKKERGGVDNRCAAFEIQGKITLPGCCSPSGCGALATFDQIGCIPNADLGRAEVACTPDVPFD
jgi:hypothetical protein